MNDKDIFENYVEMEEKKNKQIEKNEMQKGWLDDIGNNFKDFLSSKNATLLAQILFYGLLILGEWKVFEASMLMTNNNLELSLSVLLTTGVSAAVSERCHQNPKSSKRQRDIATVMWIVNLTMAAVFGFAAFMLSGKDLKYDIQLIGDISFNINGASTILFGLVSALTFFEIVAYRAYVDMDVDIEAKRRLEELREQSRKADIDLAVERQKQRTDIKVKYDGKLTMIEERLNIIQSLNEKYNGKVPDSILNAMLKELDFVENVNINSPEIKKNDEFPPQLEIEPDAPKKRQYIRSGKFIKNKEEPTENPTESTTNQENTFS